RPYVLLGRSLTHEKRASSPWTEEHGDKMWLSDELTRRVCSSGASRLFNCDLRFANAGELWLEPETPETADKTLLIATYMGPFTQEGCATSGKGSRILALANSTETRWPEDSPPPHVSALAILAAGGELSVTRSESKLRPGAPLFFRRAHHFETFEMKTLSVTM